MNRTNWVPLDVSEVCRPTEATPRLDSPLLMLRCATEITRRIDEAKRKMGRVMQIAAFSLAEVTYAVGGDIGYQVQESAKSARFRLRTRQDNVSGVLLPAFESYLTEGNNDFGLTGLGKGGQQVQRCRETYARAVEALVELASLQTAFVILDEVIKVVNRRGEMRAGYAVRYYTLTNFGRKSMLLSMSSYPAQKIPSNTSTPSWMRLTVRSFTD